MWRRNYDRPAESDVFQLQDDIASRIVATVADANGVMLRSMVATLRQRPIAATLQRAALPAKIAETLNRPDISGGGGEVSGH